MDFITAKKPLLEVQNVTVTLNGRKLLDGVSFTIQHGEQWAIVGRSGSGKTMLAEVITGRRFHQGNIMLPAVRADQPTVLLVEQQHHFRNLSNTESFFYQQRFNSSESEDSQLAGDYFFAQTGIAAQDTEAIESLNLASFFEKPLIQLSNGENKRLQIAIAITQRASLLILDNPFTGLDAAGRKIVEELLLVATEQGSAVLLITNETLIPSFVTHLLSLHAGRAHFIGTKEDFIPQSTEAVHVSPSLLRNFETIAGEAVSFEWAVRMKNVSVRYGERVILNAFNWEVKNGECWSISGPNGSGKSTLLSLITGDNPQAYANEIYIFDRRRGSGESIWDIKKRIGFVSPELHLFFEKGNTVSEVVASGLFDTIGLFRQLSAQQEQQVEAAIALLGLQALRQRPLFLLSLGEQRMVLLARALVKNPPLLILDEPCQGLDDQQSQLIRELVNELCMHSGKTLFYVSHYEKDVPSCVKQFVRLGPLPG